MATITLEPPQKCLSCDWMGKESTFTYKKGCPHTRSNIIGCNQSIAYFAARVRQDKLFKWVYCPNCLIRGINDYISTQTSLRNTMADLCAPDGQFLFREYPSVLNVLIMCALGKEANVYVNPRELLLDFACGRHFIETAFYISNSFSKGNVPTADTVFHYMKQDLDEIYRRMQGAPHACKLKSCFSEAMAKQFPDFYAAPLKNRLRSCMPLTFATAIY